jgi:hypothetical protein
MNRRQADQYLAQRGYPDLGVHKAQGVWYLIGDTGVVNHHVERCLHVVRLQDLDHAVLDRKLQELTDPHEIYSRA